MLGSFYGWYMKCQSDNQTLAVIPALHQCGGKVTCSIQLITDSQVWIETFPAEKFSRKNKCIDIGRNHFSLYGMELSIHTEELAVEGRLSYGALTPLKYDIMGPFSLVPFMECRHSVWSMQHSVFGRIMLNGESYEFEYALGYWEGDRGYSFPKKYVWTHCFFRGGSLMLSVAEIPVLGFPFIGKSISFTGVIGIVWWRGKEFRFATYLGARVVENADGRLRVVQKGMELEVRLLETGGYPLKAPELGNMVRTIHESASCRAFYRLHIQGESVFAFETERASFEYEYS